MARTEPGSLSCLFLVLLPLRLQPLNLLLAG
jgi:hypothetical protein